MMKYTNYQTPRSEWCLFYPILLIWTSKNGLKYLLNLLCNTAAMVPFSHTDNWETWRSTQLLWFAPLFIHTGKKNRIKDKLFLTISVRLGKSSQTILFYWFFLWCSDLQGPWCTVCDYIGRAEPMPPYWKPSSPHGKPIHDPKPMTLGFLLRCSMVKVTNTYSGFPWHSRLCTIPKCSRYFKICDVLAFLIYLSTK